VIAEAVKIGRHKTKREAVTVALARVHRHEARLGVLDLFGTIHFDPAWDYKADRRRGNKPFRRIF